MFGFGEAAGVTLFLGLARLGFLVAQAFEIIPVAVVFGGVLLAEIPAILAVGRFGRRPIARFLAAVPVAQAPAHGLPLGAVAPPPGTAPVGRSTRRGPACRHNPTPGQR